MVSRLLFVGLVVAIASGCASGGPQAPRTTLASDPGGAKVYEGDRLLGFAPYVLRNPGNRKVTADGCMRLEAVSVRWASGAWSEPVSLDVCASKGAVQNFVFSRPVAVPGSAFDVEFQKQYIHNEIFVQDPRNRTMSPNDLAQMYEAIRTRNAAAVKSQLFSCESTVVGNRIETACK